MGGSPERDKKKNPHEDLYWGSQGTEAPSGAPWVFTNTGTTTPTPSTKNTEPSMDPKEAQGIALGTNAGDVTEQAREENNPTDDSYNIPGGDMDLQQATAYLRRRGIQQPVAYSTQPVRPMRTVEDLTIPDFDPGGTIYNPQFDSTINSNNNANKSLQSGLDTTIKGRGPGAVETEEWARLADRVNNRTAWGGGGQTYGARSGRDVPAGAGERARQPINTEDQARQQLNRSLEVEKKQWTDLHKGKQGELVRQQLTMLNEQKEQEIHRAQETAKTQKELQEAITDINRRYAEAQSDILVNQAKNLSGVAINQLYAAADADWYNKLRQMGYVDSIDDFITQQLVAARLGMPGLSLGQLLLLRGKIPFISDLRDEALESMSEAQRQASVPTPKRPEVKK